MGWDAQAYDRQFSFVTDLGSALVDLVDARPGQRVLDLGCGTGHQTALLTDRGVDAVGLDADHAMIERARSEHPGTTYVLADAQRLSLQGPLAEPFDAVISNAALHWMPDQRAVIRGARSVLVRGGRFVAEQGGAGNVSRIWGAVVEAHEELGVAAPPLPWVFPTAAEQALRLESEGFRVALVQHLDRPTRLEPDATVATWVEMFGRELLAKLGPEVRGDLLARVDVHAERAGLRDGDGWWADYVRLRFVAEAI